MEQKTYEKMVEMFEEAFPLDSVFSANRGANTRLSVYTFIQMKRIADALEVIANKEK